MNKEKETRAIQYLQSFEPEEEPYYLCYSGGKDSDVIRILAELAGVRYDINHNLTTVDAPETVRYVRSIPGVIINRPQKTMWQLIEEKLMPPTRIVRYCCENFKEHGGEGRLRITGVRWAESNNRRQNADVVRIIGKPKTMQAEAEKMGADFQPTPKGGILLSTDNGNNRRFVEHCYRTSETTINPIVDWTDEDVWEFLHHYGCKSNPLYECGLKRIGCVGCPMAGYNGMKREFNRWPKYKQLYINAFDRMLQRRKERDLPTVWKSGEEVMKWWLGDDPNQIELNFDFTEE
jgi:phosphoadenosine phosphosulfate reductase